MSAAHASVIDTYKAMHPKSSALYERARGIIPGGVTHDGRHMKPFPVYVERALGSHKWDVDGHEYIDYWMGHGALFLGHCHPAVVKAIQEQAARGTHFGASHELEVRWAELITKLIPSAQMVRFAMSGTEATHLALRIARAFTGRNKVVKFQGHFHGWHDGVVAAVNPPYDVPMSAGVPESVLDQLLVCPPNDIKSVDTMLERGDVAAVILEPAGGQSGTTPTIPGYLQELRSLTTRHNVVLIFDEVITGFRYSPGGAQAYFGVTPDMTTLAKIVAGGLPGAAIVGKKELMSMMAHRGEPVFDRSQRVAQNGTFNSNPVCAAAAIATLELVERRVAARARQQGGRRAALGPLGRDEARRRARHLLRRGVDLPRLVRGQARPRRLRPPAPRRSLPSAALRPAQQRRRLRQPPRLDLGRAQRRRHRAHHRGPREGVPRDGRRRCLQGHVTTRLPLSPQGRG